MLLGEAVSRCAAALSAPGPEGVGVTLRTRVQTDEGVFLVYDAMIPPDNPRDSAGYLAYWNDFATRSVYYYSGLVLSAPDLGQALMDLQRDMAIDPEPIAAASPGLGRLIAEASDRPNATAWWQPLTYAAAMATMGFDIGTVAGGETLPLPAPIPCDPPPQESVKPRERERRFNRATGLARGTPVAPPVSTTPWQLIAEAVTQIGCGPDDGGGGNPPPPPPPPCPDDAGPAQGARRYAKVTATGMNNCNTWADACTLSNAIAASNAGDEVWVASGIYHPSVPPFPADPRLATFPLKNGVAIYGGFAGTECQRDQRNPVANETILSGDLDGEDGCTTPTAPDCCSQHQGVGCADDECAQLVCQETQAFSCCMDIFPPFSSWSQSCADAALILCPCACGTGNTADNSYHVVTATGTDDSAILDGVTVEGGNANAPPPPIDTPPNDRRDGAGAYVGSGSPKLVGCVFRKNVAAGNGGAVYVQNGSPTFTDCGFPDNSARYGGAVYISKGNPTFDRCSFVDNSAAHSGGGVYNSGGSLTLNNCDFTGNLTEVAGGAIYSSGASSEGTTLTDCGFTDNTARTGAGVALDASASATFTRCTFTGNRKSIGSWSDGGGLSLDAGSGATVTDCTFSNNESDQGGGIAVSSGSSVTAANSVFAGNTARYGGAVYAVSGNSTAFLVGCSFDGNVASSNGGALYFSGGAYVAVTGSVLLDNQAENIGGAIATSDSTLFLRGSELRGNYAVNQGGAVFVLKTTTTVIEDCLFENNGRRANAQGGWDVTGSGGGLYLGAVTDRSLVRSIVRNNHARYYGGGIQTHIFPGVTVTLEGCLVADNVAGNQGGGIDASLAEGGAGGTVRFVNCTVVNNQAATWGGGLWSYLLNRVEVDNSIFWGNWIGTDPQAPILDQGPQLAVVGDAALRFSNVQDGPLGIYVDPNFTFDWQLSNLQVDPLFVNALTGDYHLSGGASPSPCIDAGDSRLAVGLLDVERHPRIAGCKVDMGAFEYAVAPLGCPGPELCPCIDEADLRADLNGDGCIDADDILHAASIATFPKV